MIRIALVLVTLTFAAGCGQATHSPQAAPRTRTNTPLRTRPPAATVTSPSGTRTLVTGSFCWSARAGSSAVTGCGDAAAPALMPGMPHLQLHRGETVVVHLGFTPTAPVQATIGRAHYRLPAASVLRLRVRRGGFLVVDPRRGGDDVEYLARIVIAS